MGFRVNTNVNALNAHAQASFTNRGLSESLEKLSSGLRINKAADDASGMAIADSLRNQANSLGQAIRNANDTMGIIQIADKAMDEQIKILDSIKTKATQSAQDGQTSTTRQAIQSDVNRLLESLDNIAGTTSFNGQALLSGSFTNKEFQIGAFSNITVKSSILATSTDKIGHTRFETSNIVSTAADMILKFTNVDGKNDVSLESVAISHSAGTGIGVLVETINKNSNQLNVKAKWILETLGTNSVASGDIQGLKINDINIGNVIDVQDMDRDGKLVAAINKVKDQTGVEATIDIEGRLNLRSTDGRGIKITATTGFGDIMGISGSSANQYQNYGRLTLTRLDARDITFETFSNAAAEAAGTQYTASTYTTSGAGTAQAAINMRTVRGNFDANESLAFGSYANAVASAQGGNGVGAGVTSLRGAMAVMDIADSAIAYLDSIRADLGSVQQQLFSTINNISITEVNVRSAESVIREVDFAAESSNFTRLQILAQSGNFALSQANAVQQNVAQLLQ